MNWFRCSSCKKFYFYSSEMGTQECPECGADYRSQLYWAPHDVVSVIEGLKANLAASEKDRAELIALEEVYFKMNALQTEEDKPAEEDKPVTVDIEMFEKSQLEYERNEAQARARESEQRQEELLGIREKLHKERDEAHDEIDRLKRENEELKLEYDKALARAREPEMKIEMLKDAEASYIGQVKKLKQERNEAQARARESEMYRRTLEAMECELKGREVTVKVLDRLIKRLEIEHDELIAENERLRETVRLSLFGNKETSALNPCCDNYVDRKPCDCEKKEEGE